LKTNAFLVLQLPHIADWLWKKTQAAPRTEKLFDLTVKAKSAGCRPDCASIVC
jgi:hypothetical protein